eukprot:TRINITY_DN21772_c0_g2_i1.p1 TRINITY_DN21772_c0_g2~~TRINITY_DN21772_c0_g2_i1.p1  ORF type:complete len:241 (+),score=73.70 TRINITY_DN21772_c0_g2_i1:94-816(+)
MSEPAPRIAPSGKNARFQNEHQSKAFEEGVNGVFRSWTGLQLAKQHSGMKGERVVQEMMLDIIDWFQKEGEIFEDELEDYMSKEIDGMGCGLQDGSVEEVSQTLNMMFRECCVGNFSSAQKLSGASDAAVSKSQGDMANNDDDDEDMDEGEETAPALTPATLTQSDIQLAINHIVNLATTPEQVSTFKNQNDVVQAIYNASKEHLENEGILSKPVPKPKKKKSGRNMVSVDADGWSTVAK